MNMNVVEQITAVHIISYLECMTQDLPNATPFLPTHIHIWTIHPPSLEGALGLMG